MAARSRRHAAGLATAAAFVLPVAGAQAAPPKLPPGTLRGPAHLLHQYPTPRLATPAQRRAAEELLAQIRAAAAPWRVPAVAGAAGFGVTRPKRRAGNRRALLIFHAEHGPFRRDDDYLVPNRPETLVYADEPGEPLVLIGFMFSQPRGVRGPTPGGPITRWHTHRVCARGDARGLTPRPDGTCPPGTRSIQGSEMMHVWFTRDLRSAFAIHAPHPELCHAGLLKRHRCHGGHGG